VRWLWDPNKKEGMDGSLLDKMPGLPLEILWVSKLVSDGVLILELTFQAAEEQRRGA